MIHSMQSSESAPAALAEATTAENVEKSIREDARQRLRQCKQLLEVAGLSSFYPALRDSGAVSRADLFALLQHSDNALQSALGMDHSAVGKFRSALQETIPADLEEFLFKANLFSLMERFLAVEYTDLDDVLDDADDIILSQKASDALAVSSSLNNVEESQTSSDSRSELLSRPPWRVAERLRFEKAVQTMTKSALQVNRISISLAFGNDHSRRRGSHNTPSAPRLWGEIRDSGDGDEVGEGGDRESKRESENEEVCDFTEALADSMAIDVFTKKYFKDISSTPGVMTAPISFQNAGSSIGSVLSEERRRSSSNLLTTSAYGPRAEATARLVQSERPTDATARTERPIDMSTQEANQFEYHVQSTDAVVTPLGIIQALPANPLHLSSEAINSSSNSNSNSSSSSNSENSSSTTSGNSASISSSPSSHEGSHPRVRRRQSLDSFPRLQRLYADNFSTPSNSSLRRSSVDSRDRSAAFSSYNGNGNSTRSSTSSSSGSGRRSSFANSSVLSPVALEKMRPLRKAASKLTGRRGTFSGKHPDAVVAAEAKWNDLAAVISGMGESAEAQAEALRVAGEALGVAHGTLTVRVTGPRLGLTLDNQAGTGRLLAGFVQPNAVAWRAGLRSGDVIEAVDGDVSFSTLDAVLATFVLRDKVNGSFGNVAGTVIFTVTRPPPLLDAGYAVMLSGQPLGLSQILQQQQHSQMASVASAAEADTRATAAAASQSRNFMSAVTPLSGWQHGSRVQNAAAASHGASQNNRGIDDDDEDEEELLAAVIAEIEEEEREEALRNGQFYFQRSLDDARDNDDNEPTLHGCSVNGSTARKDLTAKGVTTPVMSPRISGDLASRDDEEEFDNGLSDDESLAYLSSLPSPLSSPSLTSSNALKKASATSQGEDPFVVAFATSLGLEALLPRLLALGVSSEQDVGDSYMFTDQELFENDDCPEVVEPWQRELFRDASAELQQNQSSSNTRTPESATAHSSAVASYGAATNAAAAGTPSEAQRHAQAGRTFEEASQAFDEEAAASVGAPEVESGNGAAETHNQMSSGHCSNDKSEIKAAPVEGESEGIDTGDFSKDIRSETRHMVHEAHANSTSSIPVEECANASDVFSSNDPTTGAKPPSDAPVSSNEPLPGVVAKKEASSSICLTADPIADATVDFLPPADKLVQEVPTSSASSRDLKDIVDVAMPEDSADVLVPTESSSTSFAPAPPPLSSSPPSSPGRAVDNLAAPDTHVGFAKAKSPRQGSGSQRYE